MKFLKKLLSKMVLPRAIVWFIDMLIIATSVFVILLLWNSYTTVPVPLDELLLVLPMLLLVNSITFIFYKTFSGILRFSSFGDLAKIVYALTIGYGVTLVFVYILSCGV